MKKKIFILFFLNLILLLFFLKIFLKSDQQVPTSKNVGFLVSHSDGANDFCRDQTSEKKEEDLFTFQRSENNHQSSLPKKENLKDEQLTSYFWVIFISLFVFCCFLYYCFYSFDDLFYLKIDYQKYKLPCDYLLFVKTILNIICLENCRIVCNNLYNKELNFHPQYFLNVCLFNDQSEKDVVRRQAREIIISFRQRLRLDYLISSYIDIVISYLLTFLLNLIINFFFHGRKTWSRLKFRSLWTMISNIQQSYQRTMCRLLIIGGALYFFLIACFFDCHYNNQYCPWRDHSLGRFWLLDEFYDDAIEPQLNYLDYRKTFFESFWIERNNQQIMHCNLDASLYDLEDFDDHDGTVQQIDNFKNDDCQNFLRNMLAYIDQHSPEEDDIYDQISRFCRPQ